MIVPSRWPTLSALRSTTRVVPVVITLLASACVDAPTPTELSPHDRSVAGVIDEAGCNQWAVDKYVGLHPSPGAQQESQYVFEVLDGTTCTLDGGMARLRVRYSFNGYGTQGGEANPHYRYVTIIRADGSVENHELQSAPTAHTPTLDANGYDFEVDTIDETITVEPDVMRVILSIGHGILPPGPEAVDREFVFVVWRNGGGSQIHTPVVDEASGAVTLTWRQEVPRLKHAISRSCGGGTPVHLATVWPTEQPTKEYEWIDASAPRGQSCEYRIDQSWAIGGHDDVVDANIWNRGGLPVIEKLHVATVGTAIVYIPPVPPTASIVGPASVTPSATCTWSASVSGGNGSYSYQWRERQFGTSTWSVPVTTSTFTYGPLYTNSREVELIVTSGSQVAGDTLHVVPNSPTTPQGCTEPGPLSVSIVGPALVNTLDVGCNYEARAPGAGPYATFTWTLTSPGGTVTHPTTDSQWNDGATTLVNFASRKGAAQTGNWTLSVQVAGFGTSGSGSMTVQVANMPLSGC